MISSGLNCGIFVHGVMKKTGKQVPPHLSNKKCNILIKNDLIYGCGNRFSIVDDKVNKI